jgi:peptidyl-prolyl cis-trans isomerase SurA
MSLNANPRKWSCEMIKQVWAGLFGIFYSWMVFAEPLDTVVAEVNDSVITRSELEQHVTETKQQLEARQVAMPPENILRKQVLQHLIDVHLQLQLAKNNNIAVEDEELNDIIKNIATQNKLSLEDMRAELTKHGIDWNHYRENIRKEVLLSRIQQSAVGKDIHISDSQIESYLKDAIQEQAGQKKYHLQNILVPLSDEPSPEEVAAARQKAEKLKALLAQGEDFSQMAIRESSDEYALEGGDLGERYLAELPDVFAKIVTDMKMNEVQGPIRTGNGWQLIKLVSINDEELHHKIVKTHVKHILVKAGPQMTDEQAEHFIQNIYRQAQAGKSFDLLAKQYSVDAATAVKGGDMGWIVSNELVPQFATVMDKLPIGQISEPVKSPFGWHIMMVLGRKTEDDSEAFQRQKVRAMLHQKRFNEAVETWQQHIRTQGFINIIDKSLA